MARFAAALLLLLASVFAFAQPEEGRDYVLLSHSRQPMGSKIEVTEFFYYGCPQCFDLEPFLTDWLAHHADIKMVRIPAFRSSWLVLAKAYYTLDILGQEARVRSQIFSAVQTQGIDLNNESVLFGWIGKHGIDEKKFESIYFSSAISSRVDDSVSAARRYGITGVPSLVVDGKFLVLGDLANPELLDKLVAMARNQRKNTP